MNALKCPNPTSPKSDLVRVSDHFDYPIPHGFGFFQPLPTPSNFGVGVESASRHFAIHCKIILLDEFRFFVDCLFMTKTTLSSKGQVVLPRLVRSRLHLAPGTRFFCEVQGDSVVLTPEHPVRHEREYVIDPLTGLRVTKAAGDSEPVTSEMIKALLEDYP